MIQGKQSDEIYTSGRLLKKRAELLLILGESEKQEAGGAVWNQNKASNSEIMQAIDLMRSAKDLYYGQWGDYHPKS